MLEFQKVFPKSTHLTLPDYQDQGNQAGTGMGFCENHWAMVNFMCQFGWAMGTWIFGSTLFWTFLVKVFFGGDKHLNW